MMGRPPAVADLRSRLSLLSRDRFPFAHRNLPAMWWYTGSADRVNFDKMRRFGGWPARLGGLWR